jgi:F1F0 ATPase subunit 2
VSDPLGAAIGVACGLIMGLIFFGGLWLTVARLTTSRNPALLVFGSFLVRTAALVPCFYGLTRLGGWLGVLGGLAGMLLMRGVLVAVLRREPGGKPQPAGDSRWN